MALPPYTPYFPISVAANLRFTDANGIPVSEMYPVALTALADGPTTGYISRIGAATSDLMTQYQQVTTLLAAYNTRITALELYTAALQASGVTFMLYVNGGCLGGNTSQPITTAVTNLMASECSYITALGSTTQLATGTAALGISALNALPAYSQNSAMSGLANWNSTLANTAQLLNNLALAYLDIRVGVTQALSQSNITCADVHVNYQGVYNMLARTITFYFYGSSIPANFSGSGGSSGTFTITDLYGHTFTQTFNLYTIIGTGYITCDISSSALAQNSQYTTVLQYALTSTTPSLGCNGGIPGTVINNTQTCPNLTTAALSASQIQFTFIPTLIDNVVYTIDVINTSGTTSGTTVIATKTYTNPAATTTDTFTGLTHTTQYWLRASVTQNQITTVCPAVSQATP